MAEIKMRICEIIKKKKWEGMKDAEKEYFGSLPLPSPRIVTTRADPGRNSPHMEFSFNNGHKLTLFSDPASSNSAPSQSLS